MGRDVDDGWRRVRKALFIAHLRGGVDGEYHKQWVINQMVRALTGCPVENRVATDCNGVEYTFPRQGESDEYLGGEYTEWVRARKDGEDGPDTYDWDEGVVP